MFINKNNCKLNKIRI